MKKPIESSYPKRIGIVTITRIGEDGYQLRYRDPESGRDIKRRIFGMPEKKMLESAAHVSQEALLQKGYLPGKRRTLTPTIGDGIIEAIKLSRMRDAVRKDAAKRAAWFVDWLGKNYPLIKTWDQIKPAMLQTYLRELEEAGKAYDTIRLRFAPIRMTWRHIARNYPGDVMPLPDNLWNARRPRKEIDCLAPGEVSALLQYLKEKAPTLYVMGCLQALCGLRMLEAAYLRLQDVDLKAKTLTVCETTLHKPKTLDSERTIPICAEALGALTGAIRGRQVWPVTGEIFTSYRNRHWKWDILSERWADVLDKAAIALNNPRIAKLTPRRLRSSFATMAGRLDAKDRLVKAYMGHIAGDTLGASYRKITVEELRSVSDRMDQWRLLIKIDEEARKKSGKAPEDQAIEA